ncbi:MULTISPECIES: hypothetical protein [unclassified Parafrankia]|uniref:hypothetical protein n=1 Tax=unclassified Parafrankia TaxID=2994368 RepID=UPI000DD3147F|nr:MULTISPECIES: hypothetical protein [unclassified Parafrankia]TCJ35094.1 hypothetical protein E0504_29920 [Parafrankia sp. BMG5.11]
MIPAAQATPPGPAASPRPPIGPAARSCCCPSAPVAQVVVPAQDGRPEQEILLCAHHLRASSERLRALGTSVYDRAGMPLNDPGSYFSPVH